MLARIFGLGVAVTKTRQGYAVGDRVRCVGYGTPTEETERCPTLGDLGTVTSWDDVAVTSYIPVIWDRVKYDRSDGSFLMIASEIEKAEVADMTTTTEFKVGDRVKIKRCSDVGRYVEGHFGTLEVIREVGQKYGVKPEKSIDHWGTSVVYVEEVEAAPAAGEFITFEEFAAFKKKVYDTAKKHAMKHGWCEVVDKALAEMGFVPQEPMKDGTVVSFGDVVGEPVFRRAQFGETQPDVETWYGTEDKTGYTWTQVVAKGGNKDVVILWEPGDDKKELPKGWQ